MALLTVEEAARYLKMSPHVLRRWFRDGKLPGFKIGSEWRIDQEDLEKYIQESKEKQK